MRGSSRRLTPKSLHRRLGVPRAPPLLRLSQLLPLAFLRPPRPRSARRFRCRPLLPPLPRGAFDRRSRLGATRLRQRAVVPSSVAPPPAPLQSLAASRLGVAPVCSALPALRYRPHAAVAPLSRATAGCTSPASRWLSCDLGRAGLVAVFLFVFTRCLPFPLRTLYRCYFHASLVVFCLPWAVSFCSICFVFSAISPCPAVVLRPFVYHPFSLFGLHGFLC